MDFALDALDTTTLAEQGVNVDLETLDGQPLLNAKKRPVGLILYGSDSKVYQTASRAMARKRVDRSAASKGKGITDDQLDAAAEDALDLLVACTKGWYGVLDSKKADVPFSPEAAKVFYTRFPPARDQAEAAIIDRARFTKASSGA